jgi:hypothetical protein
VAVLETRTICSHRDQNDKKPVGSAVSKRPLAVRWPHAANRMPQLTVLSADQEVTYKQRIRQFALLNETN